MSRNFDFTKEGVVTKISNGNFITLLCNEIVGDDKHARHKTYSIEIKYRKNTELPRIGDNVVIEGVINNLGGITTLFAKKTSRTKSQMDVIKQYREITENKIVISGDAYLKMEKHNSTSFEEFANDIREKTKRIMEEIK